MADTIIKKQSDFSWLENLAKKSGMTLQTNEGMYHAYLLLDISSSMSGKKIEQAKQGAIKFADDAIKKGYRIGILSFGSDAKKISGLTDSLQAISTAVKNLHTGGSTNMTEAITMAAQSLAELRGERAICLVTDGSPDDKESAYREAQKAKEIGIMIITIGTHDADTDFLNRISSGTNLSLKVFDNALGESMKSMALLLPKPKN